MPASADCQTNDLKQLLDNLFGGWEITALPIDQQAHYADSICKESILDPEFAHDQLSCRNCPLEQWNPTSLANIAYMALYSPEAYRDDYLKIWNNFMTWWRNRTNN